MDQIVQFNQEDMDIVVQPSIGWQDLNEQLSKMGSGLFFPVDPGKPFLRLPIWLSRFLNSSESTTLGEANANVKTDQARQARVQRLEA